VDGASMIKGDKLLILFDRPHNSLLKKGDTVQYVRHHAFSERIIEVQAIQNEWWVVKGRYVECKYLTHFDKLIYGIQI
jgi:hypothetical protein